jgi:hypothetical protein
MDEPHPFEVHFRRESRATAGVHVLVIAVEDADRAERIARGLLDLLQLRGRAADAEIVIADKWFGLPREDALRSDSPHELVLVTTACQPWTMAHLDPMLEAIERADHVVGRRQAPWGRRLARRLAWLPRKLLFAIPVLDVHSPCRLHRREALEAIPIQSRSQFVEVEVLAKATFLGHLIDEVSVPDLAAERLARGWHDFVTVLRRPVFTREALSVPAEQTEGQTKGDDPPGGKNRQRGGELGQSRPFEQDHPIGADELG